MFHPHQLICSFKHNKWCRLQPHWLLIFLSFMENPSPILRWKASWCPTKSKTTLYWAWRSAWLWLTPPSKQIICHYIRVSPLVTLASKYSTCLSSAVNFSFKEASLDLQEVSNEFRKSAIFFIFLVMSSIYSRLAQSSWICCSTPIADLWDILSAGLVWKLHETNTDS